MSDWSDETRVRIEQYVLGYLKRVPLAVRFDMRAAMGALDMASREIDRLAIKAREAEAEVARLTALLDVAERKVGEWRDRGAEAERLRLALEGVKSPARGFCWCDSSRDKVNYGHQPKCIEARAALAPAQPEKGKG